LHQKGTRLLAGLEALTVYPDADAAGIDASQRTSATARSPSKANSIRTNMRGRLAMQAHEESAVEGMDAP
jgi:hypothetical protein